MSAAACRASPNKPIAPTAPDAAAINPPHPVRWHIGHLLGCFYDHLVGILFKDTPEWTLAYTEAKQALASREHVPHGGETRASRLGRGHVNRTAERRRRLRPMQ